VTRLEGGMREVPWEKEFDAVVSWFTSLGYFKDDENRQVRVHAALRPGGAFVADLNHRDWLLSRFVSDFVVERGEDLMVDRHTFDPITGRIYNERTVVRNGRLRRFQFFTRLLDFTELRTWLQDRLHRHPGIRQRR
jgi:SAM-dependent methyltransferase